MAPARVDPPPFPASSGGLKRRGHVDGYSKVVADDGGGMATRGSAGTMGTGCGVGDRHAMADDDSPPTHQPHAHDLAGDEYLSLIHI